jgi:hypothetical protein
LETPKVGFFNSDLGTPFADDFKEGQAFTLEDAKLGPIIPTEHGPGQIVFLKINGKRYSIFGTGIVNQVQSMEPGNLPAEVKLIKKPTKVKGQSVKLIVPADFDGDPNDIPF